MHQLIDHGFAANCESMSSLAQPFSAIPRPDGVDEPSVGVRQPVRVDPDTGALAILDDPMEWGAFGQVCATNPDLWESTVVIEGMRCVACSVTIEDALNRLPGVVSAQVSAASHRARVVWSPADVRPSTWFQAIADNGYKAVPANNVVADLMRRQETRKALWRWLVAGLCMMQVMMYAWPAYIARPGDLSQEMEQLLRWASWVLTLPVILFSCGPFFRSALKDATKGRLSMDTPVALGMAITFLISTAGTFQPHGWLGREVYFDSLTMFVFFLLSGRLLELKLRDRTAGALEALMNRMPQRIRRETLPGVFEAVAVGRLRSGDLIQVAPGEAFSADGAIELGATKVDEALLTGEAKALTRGVGDKVVAGSYNLSATVHIRVSSVGAQTRFAQIVSLMQSASTTKPESARLADRFAKPFLWSVMIAATAACASWWAESPAHALMVAVAVLVVTCPCALSLATPAAMLAAAGSLARSGVLVRNLQAVEDLSQVDTVVFDKTGTLTRGLLSLTNIRSRKGLSSPVVLAMAGALAEHSLHPVSRALVRAARSRKKAEAEPEYGWHCETATESAGEGVFGLVWAGPDSRAGSQTWSLKLGSASFCGVTPSANIEGTSVHLSDSEGWLATFELLDKLRADASLAVAQLAGAGLSVYMLSGDTPGSVANMAVKAGIAHARGGCTPGDKLAFLRELQREGHHVAMVGDGLNDGPILAGAHVSFALGQAAPLAQAQSDFVILGDKLMSVVQTVVTARRAMAVVRQNIWWALIYNAACVPLAIMGYLPAWLAGLGMAGSSLLVVLNALRLARPMMEIDQMQPRRGKWTFSTC